MKEADPCGSPPGGTDPIPGDLATPCLSAMLKPAALRKVADSALVAYLGGLAAALADALVA